MIVIGLTGSIGMGKSTVAAMLETIGIPVHDADMEVHALLGRDGNALPHMREEFPFISNMEIYAHDGSIKRAALGELVFRNDKAREKLEEILHPLVHEAQAKFIENQRNIGRKMVALDIPLLFETGGEKRVHYTITVTAPSFIQRQRVMSRPGMNDKKFKAILARQMPDAEKKRRSDYVLQTGLGRAYTMRALKKIIASIREKDLQK